MCWVTIAFAQPSDWDVTINTEGADSEFFYKSVIDADGNIYAMGACGGACSIGGIEMAPTGSLLLSSFVVKFDPLGNAEWLIPFGAFNVLFVSMQDIILDADGNCYITASFPIMNPDMPATIPFGDLSISTPAGMGSQQFIGKIAPDGTADWVKQINNEDNPSIFTNSALTIDDDQHIYYSGQFNNSADFGDETITAVGDFDSDLFLSKLDTDGDFIWAQRMGSSGLDDIVSMVSDGTGLYMSAAWSGDTVFVGGLYVVNDEPLIGANFDRWIARVNDEGAAEWIVREASTDTGDDFHASLALTSDGGVMCQSSAQTTIEIEGQEVPPLTDFISKYDANGELQFVNVIGQYLGQFFTGEGDDFYMFGAFNTEQIQIGDITLTNSAGDSGSADAYFAHLDGDGTPTWAVSIGAAEFERISYATTAPDGRVIISGAFTSPELEIGENTLVNSGVLSEDAFMVYLDDPTGIVEFIRPEALEVYPNPTTDIVNVKLDLNQSQGAQLQVRDITGKTLLTKSILGNNIASVDVSTLSAGVYFLEVIQGKQRYVGKFVLK